MEADCPRCQGPLSIRETVKSGSLFSVECPQCYVTVRIHMPILKTLFALVVLGFFGLVGLAIWDLVHFEFGSYFGWLILDAIWLVFAQLALCVVAFSWAELEPMEPEG